MSVNIPTLEEFVGRYPSREKSAENEYKVIYDLIMTPESFYKMKSTTEQSLTAVEGIADDCYRAVEEHEIIEWNNELERKKLKQFIGSVVCSLMLANGFEPSGSKLVQHHAFTNAKFYQLKSCIS